QQSFQQTAALGQEAGQTYLDFLHKESEDTNLSLQQQQQYQRDYVQKVTALYTAFYDLRKARGATSAADEVEELNRRTQAYEVGSQHWIQAETQWAQAALRFREEVATAGTSLVTKFGSELKGAYVSLDDVIKKTTDDQAKATQ